MTRNSKKEQLENYTVQYGEVCKENNRIDIDLYDQYGVKRGLRDKNGEGVLAGLTNISYPFHNGYMPDNHIPTSWEIR